MVFSSDLSMLQGNGMPLDGREQDIVQAAIASAADEGAPVAATPGNVINAASCARADVQAAINLAQDGDTVMVPAGSCTWSGEITIHDKSVTVFGPGKDHITITVMDTAFILTAVPGGSNASRISGFRFDVSNGSYGIYLRCDEGQGCAQNWRVDHNEFTNHSGSSIETIFGYGNTACFPYGLVDNNIFYDARMLIYGEAYDTGGNSRWAEPLDIGTRKSLYVEDNTFYTTAYDGGYVNWIDGNVGSRYVFRFNTAYNAWTETHSVQGDDHRAQRLWEIYHNTMTCNDTGNCWMPMRMRGGTGVVFNNVTSGYNSDNIYLDNVRSCFDYAPNWGMCDGSSWIDGNEPGQGGWLCRDQPGASTDAFLWDFSSPAPAQQKAPMYAWNNKGNGGVEMPFDVLGFCPSNLLHIQENRDFYNFTASFAGTSGVGIGTLANRPPTCTPGVGYWATDQGSWNQNGADGVLYKCSPTHTWEKYYEPLTYPHPLRQGGTELSLKGIPANDTIYLTWDVDTTLPVTATWQIAYDGPTGDQPSPITGLPEPTRAYTLTGLTNYVPYTITLNAMLNNTPILTDTVTVMPTDIFGYLPVVAQGQ
jgi:hypothetical protein